MEIGNETLDKTFRYELKDIWDIVRIDDLGYQIVEQ
jgi:hypothetical protein